MEKKRIQFSAFGRIDPDDFKEKGKKHNLPFYHPAHWIFLEFHPKKIILFYDPEKDLLPSDKNEKQKKELEDQKKTIVDVIKAVGHDVEEIPLDQTDFWSGVKEIASIILEFYSNDYELIFDFSSGRRTITNMLLFAGLFISQNKKNENIDVNIICVNKPSDTETVTFSLLPKEFDIIDYQIFRELRKEPAITLTKLGANLNYSQPTMSTHYKKLKTEAMVDDSATERITDKGNNLGVVLDKIFENNDLWPSNLKKPHKKRGWQVSQES